MLGIYLHRKAAPTRRVVVVCAPAGYTEHRHPLFAPPFAHTADSILFRALVLVFHGGADALVRDCSKALGSVRASRVRYDAAAHCAEKKGV